MGHRILVVDHHPQGLQRVVKPLQKAGYEVDVAQTAAAGAVSFARLDPDLVFIAARLPRTHGTVLCRELKRTETGAGTPIVLIVEGTDVQIDLPPLDHFGADRLLQKPYSLEDLLRVCRELLDPNAENPGGQAFRPEGDDGLNTALEELDALQFDLPHGVVHGGGVPPTNPPLPLSKEHRRDIENHIDDLFSGAVRPPHAPPAPPAEPEPSGAQGTDADVVTPQPIPDPPPVTATAPGAAATAWRPVVEGGAMPGRFQTELLTRDSAPSRTPAEGSETKAFTLPRWSWVAVPVTVTIVAMAVFIMSNQMIHKTPPAVPLAATPPLGGDEPASSAAQDAATGFGLPVPGLEDPVDEPPEIAPRATAEPSPQIRAPVVTRREPPQVREPDPEPTADSGAFRQPPTAVEAEPQEVVEMPPVESIPVQPVPGTSEQVLESTSDPAPPEPAVQEEIPDPVELEPEPVTRNPILMGRVEPKVSAKDLKKGRGTVVLQVLVSMNGTVSRVLVEQGIPGSPLESAAVAAVLHWRYEPALERGEPVAAWTTARFTFDE